MRAVRFLNFLRQKSIASRKEPVQFDLRKYQLKAAKAALQKLAGRRNVIIDLPTGAGKTNIAFLCAGQVALGKQQRKKKVLYVVPTRVLIGQVSYAASWLSPEFYRVSITNNLAANRFALRAAIDRSNLIISTPGLFASLLRSGAVDGRAFNASLCFLVIDEFDEFLTIDPTEAGFKVRLEQDFAELMREISGHALLLMSGTAPKTAARLVQSFTAQLLARFVEEEFRPSTLLIPENTYKNFIPVAHVHLVPVHDAFVSECDSALGHQQQKVISDFQCDQDIWLDRDHFMDRLAAIASGLITRVRLSNGRYIAVGPELISLADQLLSIVNKYTFLFEDMFAGFAVDRVFVPVVEDCVETDRKMEVAILIDERENEQFWPSLRAKARAMLEIIRKRKSQRGIVLTRNIRLSDALLDILQKNEVLALQLDGRLSEGQRFTRIRQFSSKLFRGVLIITRTTGKRGLDLPAADYALVYSPKEDEYVMWQELSRIRSTLARGKDSYILYYENTAEAQKLKRLENEMRGSANRYVFATESL